MLPNIVIGMCLEYFVTNTIFNNLFDQARVLAKKVTSHSCGNTNLVGSMLSFVHSNHSLKCHYFCLWVRLRVDAPRWFWWCSTVCTLRCTLQCWAVIPFLRNRHISIWTPPQVQVL